MLLQEFYILLYQSCGNYRSVGWLRFSQCQFDNALEFLVKTESLNLHLVMWLIFAVTLGDVTESDDNRWL